MAIIGQAFGAIKLDKAAGTLVDISAQVVTATLNVQTRTGTYATLGSSYDSAVDGKKGWSVDVEFYMTTGTSESEAYDLISTWVTTAIPGARSLELYTPDSTTNGSLKFSGEVKIQTSSLLSIDASSTQPQRFRCTLVGDGTLTKATVSA